MLSLDAPPPAFNALFVLVALVALVAPLAHSPVRIRNSMLKWRF
jgi:hypothetical protein